MSWTDIVGDYEDMVGAVTKGGGGIAPRKQLPAWFARQRAVAAAVPQQTQVTEGGMGVPRRLPLPLPSTIINPGAQVNITQRAQILMRAERLVLTSSATPSNVSVQAFVGVFPQTVSAGFIPLDVFRATAFGVDLAGNTLQVGNDFTLQSINNGGVAETVGGAVIGTALQP